MANTGLHGPYSLTKEKVDVVITQISPGTYVLGKVNTDKVFIIKYVGRSDSDIKVRLLKHIGEYPYFKFDYMSFAKSAFEKECTIWHDFGGPDEKMDNKIHPQRPAGTSWQCPKCDVFKSYSW